MPSAPPPAVTRIANCRDTLGRCAEIVRENTGRGRLHRYLVTRADGFRTRHGTEQEAIASATAHGYTDTRTFRCCHAGRSTYLSPLAGKRRREGSEGRV